MRLWLQLFQQLGSREVGGPLKVSRWKSWVMRTSLAAVLMSGLLFGQAFTGSISGLVQDPSGSVIVATSITVTDIDKNTSFRTASNDTGFFLVSALPPGRYRVTAERTGFRSYVLDPLVLNTQQKAELNIRLEIGALSETVRVTAENQLMETASSTLSTVMEGKLIRDLPLNGRNVLQLALTVPGVFGESPMAQAGSSFMFMSNRIMINGGQNETNDIMIDGVSASVPHNNPALIAISAVPSVEGVQEFRVQTNAFSAEYGRSGGGLITLVTRSGTNEIHGSLFEFLRNSVMDANSWQANRAGVKLASFKRNQFGLSLGGPIYIPRVYNGHSRTFFFTVFDADRSSSAATAQYSVPTLLERQGDFSQSFAANGQLRAIYNPFSIRPDPARPGSFLSDPFAGNRLPSNLINPVATSAVKFYPEPNGPGQPFTHANNFVVQAAPNNPPIASN